MTKRLTDLIAEYGDACTRLAQEEFRQGASIRYVRELTAEKNEALAAIESAVLERSKQGPVSYADFNKWMHDEMPADTVIGNSDWWASRIYRKFIASPQARKPLTDEQIRAEFAKLYPNDDAILSLSENNRDYALEAIGARHHWTAFKAGARAIAAAERGEA